MRVAVGTLSFSHNILYKRTRLLRLLVSIFLFGAPGGPFVGARFFHIVGSVTEKRCKRKFGVSTFSLLDNSKATEPIRIQSTMHCEKNPRSSEAAKGGPRYKEGSLYSCGSRSCWIQSDTFHFLITTAF